MEWVRVFTTTMALIIAVPAIAVTPYVHGRLPHPAYAEIAGAPDEAANIKTYAIAQGWAVVCEQHVGKQTTMRIRFPVGTSQEIIEGYFARDRPPGRVSKVQMVYYGMNTAAPLCLSLP